MKQLTLSKKEKKGLNEEILKAYGLVDFFQMGDFVVLVNDTYILKDSELMFFYTDEDVLLPSLKLILKKNFLLKIVVDMGAVPFVAKGADLMRPGIVGVDADVDEGSIVVIVDEQNMKPLAIGQSLFSKLEMEEMEAGKMVVNLHYVGDEVWNFAP
jgi:PUA-domain protein